MGTFSPLIREEGEKNEGKEEKWERNDWRRREDAKLRCDLIIPSLLGNSSPLDHRSCEVVEQ